MPDVIIIGAGLTGLSCAWRLQQSGIDTLILESSDRAGGVVRTERISGYLVERGPNTFRTTPDTLALLDETGLTERIRKGDPRAPRYICFGHRLRKAPFGPMSIGGILRTASEPMVRSKSPRGESVRDFFVRRIGIQAHDRLVGPALTGIYAGDTANLSMAAVFPKLVEMERKHGSLLFGMLNREQPKDRRGGGTITFQNGMEELPQRLARDLRIQFGTAGVRVNADRSVEWTGGKAAPHAVVITAPAGAAADIVRDALPGASATLRQIVYVPMTIAVSSLPANALPQPLRGFGFLVPRSEKLHTLGVLFTSALFPGRAPEGQNLLTTFIGGAHEPETIDWNDAQIWESVRTELQTVLKSSSKPQPLALYRHRNAIPQYTIGHEDRIAALRGALKAIPGLFVDGNYLDGISVSACLDNGQRTARQVVEYLRSKS